MTFLSIGHTHGHGAKSQVHGSIAFYSHLFQQKCALDWPAVTREAEKYVSRLEVTCPRYLDEMRGIAEGAGVGFLDVLALNVRTEIMFGLFTEAEAVRAKGETQGGINGCGGGGGGVNGKDGEDDFPSDGCTSLSFHPPNPSSSTTSGSSSFLAQSWDWQPAQSPNLIILHITTTTTTTTDNIPSIAMVTEAGIIGKIGLNSAGVGVCLNAIRARGLDTSRLPVHLALRTLLESNSLEEGKTTLQKLGGVAGSAHILLGDPSSAVGLEFAGGRGDIGEITPDKKGRVLHTNHLLLEHPGVDEPGWLPDSGERLARMTVLTDGFGDGAQVLVADRGEVDLQRVLDFFKDEDGFPCSINRLGVKEGESQTLFTIIMDLGRKKALVKVGRPTEGGEEIYLGF
ncbi:isopenicillin-N N-acyltransferase [Diaporthe helianthi]|uniref:Isopenicillin-N N-acyltransferase n=1 Tax=Diaporthe helianthi TaxID=158607 RepID=A0A2P5HRM3_DIAHE|nr:isopenicillin-N N-acyltransferase [Diaporthe helianthi]